MKTEVRYKERPYGSRKIEVVITLTAESSAEREALGALHETLFPRAVPRKNVKTGRKSITYAHKLVGGQAIKEVLLDATVANAPHLGQ